MYWCFFCGGSFKRPMDRLLHVQERGSRCSIAAGALLADARNEGYPKALEKWEPQGGSNARKKD